MNGVDDGLVRRRGEIQVQYPPGHPDGHDPVISRILAPGRRDYIQTGNERSPRRSIQNVKDTASGRVEIQLGEHQRDLIIAIGHGKLVIKGGVLVHGVI